MSKKIRSVLRRELEEGFLSSSEYEQMKQLVRKYAIKLGKVREFTVQQLIEEYDLTPDKVFVWMQLRALVNEGVLQKSGRGYYRTS